MGSLKGGQLLLQAFQPWAACRKERGPGNSRKLAPARSWEWDSHQNLRMSLPVGGFLLMLRMGN